MGAQIVNLEGTQYISDVPSVYYGATSSLVSKIDPFAGNLKKEKKGKKRGQEKKGTGKKGDRKKRGQKKRGQATLNK
jgi:hypothetical protein